jgi:3',5'-cyclic AMP phosphodiesterase CpdA
MKGLRSKNRLALAEITLLLLVMTVLVAGCGTTTSSRASSTPATAPAETVGARFSFIVCGDPQNNYQVFDKILAAARSVDFLIIAGDLTGSGTRAEFGTFVSVMKDSGVRYYCVPGNHDVAAGPAEQIYASFMGPTHQSFDYENSHFVLIDDSSPGLGFYPSERDWVRSDLAAASARRPEHVFAVCHVAPGYPYSLNPADAGADGKKANEALLPVLERGGVEELFSGHMHAYDQDMEDGMLVTVTGGAGAPLHMSPQNGGYFHYVRVDIDGKRRVQRVVRI